MKRQNQNIEDLLKDKADSFETPYSPDWSDFEQKLERALFFRRMKVGAIVTVVLILLNIGIFGTSSIYDFIRKTKSVYYQPRLEVPFQISSAVSSSTVTEAQPVVVSTVLNTDELLPTEREAAQVESSENKAVPVAGAQKASATPVVKVPAATATPLPPVADKTSTYAVETSPAPEAAVALTNEQPDEIIEMAPMVLMVSRQLELDGAIAALGSYQAPAIRTTPETVNTRQSGKPYISPLQEDNPWSCSFNVYPNWTFRKFLVDQGKERFLHRDFIDAMQVSESGGVSLNVGLKVSRRIGPITYLNSGVEYISYKTEARFDFLNFRTAHINEEGEITSYSLKNETERVVFNDLNAYHYINVPFSISHEPWVNDHIRLNIEGGFSFMYFLAAEGKTVDYTTLDVIDLSSRSYQNKLGSAFIKTGATYHISDKFNLGFEPTLMYFTNTIYTEEYPFKVIPYSVGMNVKLQVKLN